MCLTVVFANASACEIGQLRSHLCGPWRQGLQAVMVLLSARGLAPAQTAALLDCDPSTVRRWIGRFNAEGMAGLADRPRSGRPARLGAGVVCVDHSWTGYPACARSSARPEMSTSGFSSDTMPWVRGRKA